MSGPTYAALRRHDQRVRAMLADPDLTRDLLLLGVVIARGVDLRDPPPPWTLHGLADRAFAHDVAFRGADLGRWRVRDLIRQDRRRYEPDMRRGRCAAMLRRAGRECGRGWTRTEWITDWDTGERQMLGACSRHLDWLRVLKAHNHAESAGREAPVPCANAGGVLARHLPEIDWHGLWRRLDERWTPPPEREPWRPPTLQLLPGDGEPSALPRPELGVVIPPALTHVSAAQPGCAGA